MFTRVQLFSKPEEDNRSSLELKLQVVKNTDMCSGNQTWILLKNSDVPVSYYSPL